MTYLLLHMLVMTVNEISKQNKSYDVWCQHNKIRLPSQRSILELIKMYRISQPENYVKGTLRTRWQEF